jgi:hypothetical protein
MGKKITKSDKPTNTEKYSRGIDDMSQLHLDNHISGKYVSKTKTQALKNCRKTKNERIELYYD